MEPIGEPRLTPITARLAATLAILTLGFAAVAWEWRNAHTAALKHGRMPTHHHHGVGSSAPETAAAARNQ
jgi:hypothetical protein